MPSRKLEFAVLQRRDEIAAAERELRKRGLIPPAPGVRERALGAVRRAVGRPDTLAELRPDPVKSWDVLRALEVLRESLEWDDPVLDIGSIASATLPALHRIGYRRLFGIDLDERVLRMAHVDGIEYTVGDATRTRWPDGFFAAVTAISVIEHGVPEERLLQEVSRLLRPRGLFLFSTDYWPEKIDTAGVELFGVEWRIFSAAEIEAFIERARGEGLEPVADPGPRLRAVEERPIRFEQRDYTFLYGALVRRQS